MNASSKSPSEDLMDKLRLIQIRAAKPKSRIFYASTRKLYVASKNVFASQRKGDYKNYYK
jgi:hypothetical protein